MSNNTAYRSERLEEIRSEYLLAAIDRQEALERWKRLEKRHAFLKCLMLLSVILGALTAVAVWLPYRHDLTNLNGYLYALIALLAGLVLCIIFGFLSMSVSAQCCRAYVDCYTTEIKVEKAADAIKAQTLDPVLENAIIVSARSRLTAPVREYDPTLDLMDVNEAVLQRFTEYKKSNKRDGYATFYAPVNSAVIFIDDVEAGALDLGSDFSVFRVAPGLHTVKIKLKKQYASIGKALELETPVSTVFIDGNYRVQLYTLDAKLAQDTLSYSLRVAEYDDVATFRRDVLNTDHLEKMEREAELSHRLVKRARHLYREMHIKERYAEIVRSVEQERYEREKHRWINQKDVLLQTDIVRSYQQKAKHICKKMFAVKANEKLSDKRREQTLATLDAQLDELAAELYSELIAQDRASMVGMQKSKLKSILLLGQENVRYEEIARRIEREQTYRLTEE